MKNELKLLKKVLLASIGSFFIWQPPDLAVKDTHATTVLSRLIFCKHV